MKLSLLLLFCILAVVMGFRGQFKALNRKVQPVSASTTPKEEDGKTTQTKGPEGKYKPLNRIVLSKSERKFSKKVESAPSNANSISQSPKIVGGYEVKAEEVPSKAAIIIDGYSFCGGFLVDRCWVVTAAHCAYNFHQWQVMLGVYELYLDKEVNRQTFLSNVALVHPEYDDYTINKDIAMIYIGPRCANIPTDYIKKIHLPYFKPFPDLTGELLKVCGWGLLSETDWYTPNLASCVEVIALPDSDCLDYYGPEFYTADHICTSEDGYKGACYGDSGGALMKEIDGKMFAVGIVSYGNGCGTSPTVYTRLTSFIDWIHNVTCQYSKRRECELH